MLWKCILLLSICLFNQQITGQDSQLANPNSNFWDQYEVVSTQRTSGSLSALDRCGEGKNKGVNICVPYYNCDGVTNFIKVDSATDGFGLIDIRFETRRILNIIINIYVIYLSVIFASKCLH